MCLNLVWVLHLNYTLVKVMHIDFTIPDKSECMRGKEVYDLAFSLSSFSLVENTTFAHMKQWLSKKWQTSAFQNCQRLTHPGKII